MNRTAIALLTLTTLLAGTSPAHAIQFAGREFADPPEPQAAGTCPVVDVCAGGGISFPSGLAWDGTHLLVSIGGSILRLDYPECQVVSSIPTPSFGRWLRVPMPDRGPLCAGRVQAGPLACSC